MWTRVVSVQHRNQSHKLTPTCAYYCPAYTAGGQGADAGCPARAAPGISARGSIDFYSQERQLHGPMAEWSRRAAGT